MGGHFSLSRKRDATLSQPGIVVLNNEDGRHKERKKRKGLVYIFLVGGHDDAPSHTALPKKEFSLFIFFFFFFSFEKNFFLFFFFSQVTERELSVENAKEKEQHCSIISPCTTSENQKEKKGCCLSFWLQNGASMWAQKWQKKKEKCTSAHALFRSVRWVRRTKQTPTTAICRAARCLKTENVHKDN